MSRRDDSANLPPIGGRFPEFCDCGEPQPCRRACLEAYSALADYWETEAYPSGEEGVPRSGKAE